mgnify:CR=1 FL=1
MRSRIGYVSNSSSSSFIVQTKDPIDLARQMLEIVRDDWLDWGDNKIRNKTKGMFKQCFDNLDSLGGKLHGADGIMLPSTNYDTYILPCEDWYGDKCLVTTCNNQNWDNIGHITSISDTEEYLLNRLVSKSVFFDVRSGLVLHYPTYPEGSFECPKCKEKYFEYYLTLDNHKICGSCHKQMD